MSLLLGAAGIIGAMFIPLLGIGFGVAGLVMGSLSRNSTKRHLSTLGLVAAGLAILAGLSTWAYAVQQLNARQNDTGVQQSSTAHAELITPCYALNFVHKLNIQHNPPSCDAKAYNNQTLETSTQVYKISAVKSVIYDAGSFNTVAKNALEKDIAANLPGFAIDSQRVGAFAGSPAYIINASDKKRGIAIVEAAVLRKVSTGDNIFLLVHAVNGESVDLTQLEAEWQWK